MKLGSPDSITLSILKGLFLVLICADASADAVSEDLIFSEAFKGGLPCEKIGEAYLGEPVQVYSEATERSKIAVKQKLTPACTQGGGDCVCHALYLDEVKTTVPYSFFKVLDSNKKTVWIKVETAIKKSLYSLATETERGNLSFKNPEQDVFIDRELRKKMKFSEVTNIPKEILEIMNKEVPQIIGTLEIMIPRSGMPYPELGTIDFWRSTSSMGDKPFSLKVEKLRSMINFDENESENLDSAEYHSEKNEPFQRWELKVLKNETDKFLVVGKFSAEGISISSYSSENSPETFFFWVRPNSFKFKYIPNSNLGPLDAKNFEHLILTKLFSPSGVTEIKGQLYTEMEAVVSVANPLKAETSGAPETIEAKRYPVRKFWLKTYDDKGRIQFWISRPGC